MNIDNILINLITFALLPNSKPHLSDSSGWLLDLKTLIGHFAVSLRVSCFVIFYYIHNTSQVFVSSIFSNHEKTRNPAAYPKYSAT